MYNTGLIFPLTGWARPPPPHRLEFTARRARWVCGLINLPSHRPWSTGELVVLLTTQFRVYNRWICGLINLPPHRSVSTGMSDIAMWVWYSIWIRVELALYIGVWILLRIEHYNSNMCLYQARLKRCTILNK